MNKVNMNNKKLFVALAGIGIAIGIAVVGMLSYSEQPKTPSVLAKPLDFDYEINSIITEKLSEKNILMSSPIKINTAAGIEKYCTFFDDEGKQQQIEYCTSTELKNNRGDFLGNIHMVGSFESPKLMIVILDSTFLQIEDVAEIFDTVIDTTVCECWEDKSPAGFSNVSNWANGLSEFHQDAEMGITTKSSVVDLEGKKLQIELTSTPQNNLWKLFVAT